MKNQFAEAGFPLTHQGGNVYAYQMQIGDRFILITEEMGGYCVGLHSAVDCITYADIPDVGADTAGTAILFAQRLVIACYVRAVTRAITRAMSN